MEKIQVRTQAKKQVVDITDRITKSIREEGAAQGWCRVFVAHTTAALSTADLDPGTDLDMLDAFTEMIPDLTYRHPHNPEHAPDHILATLVGSNIAVPVIGGKLQLGTWQRIVLFEFDGPRNRDVVISFIPDIPS